MIAQIAYYQILGKPLILYFGIVTYTLFIFTALIPILNNKKIWDIRFIWHVRIAKIAILVASAHALMGILSYFS